MDGFIGVIALLVIIAILCGPVRNGIRTAKIEHNPPVDPEVQAWRQKVYAALEDHVLTHEEEKGLSEEAERLFSGPDGIIREKLQREPAWMKLLQGIVIRELVNGELPQQRINFQQFPFNLQKGETLIWAFNDVSRYEPQVIRSSFTGGSMGASFRVAKGVYLRPSMFSGESTSETRTVLAGSGALGITTKNIYFHDTSGGRSLRVPYQKIVSFSPYKDGIGFTQDSQTAKPQRFQTSSDDGWFIYNLVTNLSQRE